MFFGFQHFTDQQTGIWLIVLVPLAALCLYLFNAHRMGKFKKHRSATTAPNEGRTTGKTILVIACALFLGLMLGLTMRHLI